jgi:hypothetical protein
VSDINKRNWPNILSKSNMERMVMRLKHDLQDLVNSIQEMGQKPGKLPSETAVRC